MAQRIVSLVPSTTESVCALGLGAALVGCTRYCTEPAEVLAAVPRVGGTKNPDKDAVLALRPDLVLVNAEENRAEDIEWLAARAPVLVQTPRSVPAAAACLRELAEVIGVPEAVVPFLLRIEAQLAAAAVECLPGPPLRTFYAIWRKPWMTVGADTFVHDVMQRVGLANVVETREPRYPTLALDEIRALRPRIVLLPSEPWEFTEHERRELVRERAFGDAIVELCDGRDFCWHGVRMADGLGRIRRLGERLRAAAPSDC